MNHSISLPQATTDHAGTAQPRFPVTPAIPILWLGLGAIGLIAAIATRSDLPLIGIFATVVVTIPLLGLAHSDFRWFHPMIFVCIPAIIGLGMRAWYLLYATERDGARKLLLGTNAADTVLIGTSILAVGLSILVVGFISRPDTKSPLVAPKPQHNWIASWGWTNLILIGAIVIGVVATLLYFRAIGGVSLTTLSAKRYIELDNGGFSSGAFYSRGSAIPVFAALPVIARKARGGKVPVFTQFLVLGCLLVSVVSPFVSSSRAEVIVILTIVAITWSSQAAFSLRLLLIGSLSMSVLLVMGSLRCETQTGGAQGCSVSGQVEDSLLANENWMSVSKTAHIYEKVPYPVPYQYGKTFGYAFIAPIPRVIWDDKPSVRADQLVGPEILGLSRERRAGAPPGIVGELYLNWGWPGILGGMFAMGWFLRWLWDWQGRYRSDLVVSCFAIVLTHIALRLPAGDFTGSLLPLVQGLAIVITVMWIGSLHRNRGESPELAVHTMGEIR